MEREKIARGDGMDIMAETFYSPPDKVKSGDLCMILMHYFELTFDGGGGEVLPFTPTPSSIYTTRSGKIFNLPVK